MVIRFTVGEDRFEAASNDEANARSWPGRTFLHDRSPILPTDASWRNAAFEGP